MQRRPATTDQPTRPLDTKAGPSLAGLVEHTRLLEALDQALRQHGAPARPVPERPILWMKNPRTGRT